jgi:micrococcal nuclease
MRFALRDSWLLIVGVALLGSLLAEAAIPEEGHQVYYRAYVHDCHDADTCDASILLGFGLSLHEKIRLARINAWEVTGEEKEKGDQAAAWLNGQIGGKEVMLKMTDRLRDKYGRVLADVYVGDRCLNDEAVTLGHARYQDYD